MSRYAAKHQIPVSGVTFSIYHDTEYKEKNVDVELCAAVRTAGENTEGFTYRITEPVPYMPPQWYTGHFLILQELICLLPGGFRRTADTG